jgi:DNA-binding NarL/FixJ family response regulator
MRCSAPRIRYALSSHGLSFWRRNDLHRKLKKLIVIMLTTADDMRDIEKCHAFGCSAYIQEPVDYENFAEAMRRVGQFTELLLVPMTVDADAIL